MINLLQFSTLLENNPISLATVNNHQQPNIAIAGDVKVKNKTEILIAHNEMKKTITNIQDNHYVCLTCFDPHWKGIRIYGAAHYFTSGEDFEAVQNEFATPTNQPQGAILIQAQSVEEME